MKNRIITILLNFSILLIFLVLIGCRTYRQPLHQSTEKITLVKEVVRDTIFYTQPDYSSIQALIECENSKPVIKEILKTVHGKTVQLPPKIILKDNILTADCTSEAQRLFVQWKEKHTQTEQTKTVIQYKEKELTKWQKARLFLSSVLLVLLGLAFFFGIYKLKKHIL